MTRLPFPALAVPVLTCLATLGALTLWTATGNAGSPARISVAEGTVWIPSGASAAGRPAGTGASGGAGPESTAAFFTLRNTGGAPDVLTGVTGPAGHRAMLSRTVDIGHNARSMAMVRSATVPAGGTLRMTPTTVDIMISPAPTLAPGDRLTLTLHFRDGPPRTVRARAVRPGG
ncbi:copper chaperone PCu(A)C [Streptomyces sp. NPDC020742]|uniref:copper chaperone PCu(A)C n=1 Tax=unclassified Streptomyces TaxID=2593676 RepID=UPI0033C4BB31